MINLFKKIIIGKTEQWIMCKGEDISKPVILFLHGGPGFSLIPFSDYFKKLEDDFIVVNWDQRGAGKSYNEALSPETMTLKQLLSDTYDIVQYLKKEFKKEKIFLAGHSWGSILGTYLIKEHPDDFFAYIGIGQVVDAQRTPQIQYNFALKTAKEQGNEDIISSLTRLGAPPFDSNEKRFLIIGEVEKCGGGLHSAIDFGNIINSCLEYSEQDKENFAKGIDFSCYYLWEESKVKLTEEYFSFDIPVYYISGRYDYLVPSELVEEYYHKVNAPQKRLIWFDNSAHFPFIEEPEQFYNVMTGVVLKETFKDI